MKRLYTQTIRVPNHEFAKPNWQKWRYFMVSRDMLAAEQSLAGEKVWNQPLI